MKPKTSWKTMLVILGVAFAGLALLSVGDGKAAGNAAVTAIEQTAPTAEAPASAVAEESDTALAEEFSGSVTPALLRMGIALVAVVACIYLGLLLLKKTMGKKFSSNRSGKSLEVIETTYLAPKKQISLVRVAGKAVLIGMTESQISMLIELDEDQTAELLAADKEEPLPAQGFDQLIGKAAKHLARMGLKRKEPALES
ncbi:MAG TPA: flagellar biosynthetic protein FliO [candidate division Zixibacteria bacterium]|nr:flagellar biosynthetic protein FliO [candidate division Zixibacteria bacterium]